MPPQLALALCVVFVLLLLAIERRTSREVSAAVWIPTIWMLMIASRPLAIWFGIVPSHVVEYGGNESGSPLDRWTLTVLDILAITIFVRRQSDWLGTLRRHKWLVALLAYMFVSTFWSDLTLVALRRWVRESIALTMALYLMSERNPRQALASVLRRSAYILLPFSIVLIKYYPILGRSYGKWSGTEMWTGVTGQKNLLGRLCMISAFFLLWEVYRRWWRPSRVGADRYQMLSDVSVILIALYLLIRSRSDTSTVTLVVGIAFYLGLLLFRRLKFTIPKLGMSLMVIALMVFGTATPFVGGATVVSFTSALGRDTTLTGRTQVWADILPARAQRPLFGYGLGSFWTDERRAFYDIPTAHNGYLDVLLELGETGLAIYGIWLLSFVRQMRRAMTGDWEWASLAICFLIMGLLYNISESALNTFTEQMTVVPLLASFVVFGERIQGGGLS